VTAQTGTPARRPRDRKQQIIASAARQFRASGFHNVGITEIAESLGITSAALYRHFSGKQDLLLATVTDAIEQLRALWAREGADLEELLEATVDPSRFSGDVGVLWAREIGHLPPDTQRELRDRLVTAIEPVRSALGRARPDLSSDVVDLLLWAAVGVISGPSYNTIKLEPRRRSALLLEACLAVCRIESVAAAEPGRVVDEHPPDGAALLPASRQEAILTAATRLFSARGYQEVGVDDIGAAVGITGATVYHHFTNKQAILTAALSRFLQALLFDLSGALDNSPTPSAALDKVLRGFVRICVERGHVIAALENEVINLPAEERRELLDAQVGYISEWAALLVGQRSDLSEPEAMLLARAAVSSLAALVAIPHIRRRATFDRDLLAVGRAVLGLDLPDR
jgi:AcrR family transcriptional regulator